LLEYPHSIATRIVWLDPLEGTARELLADAEAQPKDDDPKKKQAARFLTQVLAKAARPHTEIEELAVKEGISRRTLRRASEGMVEKKPNGFGGSWTWTLI